MKKTTIWKLITTLVFAAAICFVIMPVRAQAATVKLNRTKKTIYVGHYYKLKLKNATGKITWKSTDKSVATVTSTGKVKAKTPGKCKIKATNNGKTYYCTVTVKAVSGSTTPTPTPTPVPAPEHTAYGDKAFTTFSLTDYTTGKTVDNSIFSDYELTVVNFWEYWCGPCVNELPDLEKLYENYKDKGLNVIGIYGDGGSSAEAAIAKAGLKYTLLNDSDYRLYSDWGNGYVPYTMLVDGYGNVIGESRGAGSRSYSGFEAFISPYIK